MAWTKTPTKPTTKPKYTVPMRVGENGIKRYFLEGETKEIFVQLYPKHSARRLMAWFGVSYRVLHRFARELALQKDMVAIRKEQARDTKRTCERNGYYASIRGKRPSEACMEGARMKRAEGYHPLLQIKETNPRKYKKLMKKRSEKRKELVHKERLRLIYGLPQKTKLNLPLYSLTQTAYSHKYQMIKSCNYYAVEGDSRNVYYDSQTKRSARREATAIRHGLRVVQGDEETENNNL